VTIHARPLPFIAAFLLLGTAAASAHDDSALSQDRGTACTSWCRSWMGVGDAVASVPPAAEAAPASAAAIAPNPVVAARPRPVAKPVASARNPGRGRAAAAAPARRLTVVATPLPKAYHSPTETKTSKTGGAAPIVTAPAGIAQAVQTQPAVVPAPVQISPFQALPMPTPPTTDAPATRPSESLLPVVVAVAPPAIDAIVPPPMPTVPMTDAPAKWPSESLLPVVVAVVPPAIDAIVPPPRMAEAEPVGRPAPSIHASASTGIRQVETSVPIKLAFYAVLAGLTLLAFRTGSGPAVDA